MSTYEGLHVILGAATLIVTILIYMNSENGTKITTRRQVSWLFLINTYSWKPL